MLIVPKRIPKVQLKSNFKCISTTLHFISLSLPVQMWGYNSIRLHILEYFLDAYNTICRKSQRPQLQSVETDLYCIFSHYRGLAVVSVFW